MVVELHDGGDVATDCVVHKLQLRLGLLVVIVRFLHCLLSLCRRPCACRPSFPPVGFLRLVLLLTLLLCSERVPDSSTTSSPSAVTPAPVVLRFVLLASFD